MSNFLNLTHPEVFRFILKNLNNIDTAYLREFPLPATTKVLLLEDAFFKYHSGTQCATYVYIKHFTNLHMSIKTEYELKVLKEARKVDLYCRLWREDFIQHLLGRL